MNTLRKQFMMFLMAVPLLFAACSKDSNNGGNAGDDYSVTPTSLVGTTWSASATEGDVEVYASLSFTTSTQVVYVERYGSDEVSGTGTYVYHAPQGTFYYTYDGDSYEVPFTVDGPVMRVALPGNPNAVFIRQ
ncbi:MAG: hypothetical protein IJT61_04725 [Bacteroidales bacterium]|nr:hypothetical protein [Bacteroidales bacterium]MBQ7735223.1 hypothetical protein [Bacteroidales bacterium]